MDIASVEVVPYALPFREPYVTARGTLSRREMALVRLRDGDGLEGLGDAVPLSLRGGATLAQVVEELEASGGELHPALAAPSRAALETARLDLEARRAGVPAWRLLGARSAAPVTCNATLAAGAPQAVAAAAARWRELGFRSFKLKLGTGEDAEQVAAVRAALGDGPRIRVDANGTWTVARAQAVLAAIERHDVELAEEPAGTLEDLARVRETSAIRVAADESVASIRDAERALALGACDLCTVKLAKVGGPTAALAIARRIPAYLSSALDGPVGIAAAAHVAQALRDGGDAEIAHGLATESLFAGTIAAEGCGLDGDRLSPPEAPGLGVVLDEEALARHRL